MSVLRFRFAEDIADVPLYSILGDEKFTRDLRIAEPFIQKHQNFSFPSGKLIPLRDDIDRFIRGYLCTSYLQKILLVKKYIAAALNTAYIRIRGSPPYISIRLSSDLYHVL